MLPESRFITFTRQNYEDTGLPKGENELFYFQTVTERVEDLMNLTLKPERESTINQKFLSFCF